MRRFLNILLLIGLVIGFRSKQVNAQYSFSETPLLQVLEELNRESEYILLYRESLVKSATVTLTGSEEDIFERLKPELLEQGLDLIVDDNLKQVVIFKSKEPVESHSLEARGFIMDAWSGERLSFATVSWLENGEVTGVAANEAGYFSLQIKTDKEQIELQSSYIGYETQALRFTWDELSAMSELSIRLNPVVTNSREVVITGLRQFTDNSAVQKAVDIAQGSILGEENTIKALQQLPSVTLGPALSEGLNVRGSPSDGFQVLLDGVTIYNQTHLFGLFDNFNADALQTSGLYYGVTPASYQAPVGGTLALITRTGSVNEYRAEAGASNTSLNVTVEGPLSRGKASFLLSGRTSFIDKLNWLGNDDLVRWGLDVDRPARFLSPENVTLRTDLVHPVSSSAAFGDVHAKLNLESESGSRFMLTGYYGYDDIVVDAERLFRSFSAGQGSLVDYQPVQSENRWNNGKLSAHLQHRLSQHLFNDVTAGWSVFNTHFSKDDFTYTQINPGTGALESFTSDIIIKSILNEVVMRDELEWIHGEMRLNGGLSYHYFMGEYFEDSFERPSYFKNDKAHKMDAWLHSEFTPLNTLKLSGGVRSHFYSQGNYFNLSPRLNVSIFPESEFSLDAGYSRNYQYVNRISFSNVLSSDVWILVDEEQPPAFVDNFTAGMYYRVPHLLIQLEGYLKDYEHLRLHEIETYSVTNAFSSSPWFSDNSGTGKGLELLLINEFQRFALNQSLTLSRIELQNPDINDGAPYLADWNRSWQYTGALSISWFEGFETTITQMYGTGTPNKLSVFSTQNNEQLEDYFRTDLRVSWQRTFNGVDLDASVSFYNIFDVSNPWYRDISFGLDESSSTQRFVSIPVEVYDLGFQPSFSISVKF